MDYDVFTLKMRVSSELVLRGLSRKAARADNLKTVLIFAGPGIHVKGNVGLNPQSAVVGVVQFSMDGIISARLPGEYPVGRST